MARKPLTSCRLLDGLTPSEGGVLLILAIIVGAASGLAAVGLIRLLALVEYASYRQLPRYLPQLGPWLYVVAPLGGALLAAPFVAWAKEVKGDGTSEVLHALIMNGGRIRPRVVVAKIVATALCLGSGGSAGREGPIVQVGSALGSTLGHLLHLSGERCKNLVGCGAAAGVAAAFNAPLAGVAFALEVLRGEPQLRHGGTLAIAAACGSLVSRALLGEQPAFTVPSFSLTSPLAILLYLLLGLVAALVAIMFMRMLSYSELYCDKLSLPLVFKPALGAILLGVIGLCASSVPGMSHVAFPATAQRVLPELENMPLVYGSGFPLVTAALQGHVEFWLLGVLIFLKPLATSFTLGSGNSGGVFAPSLFLGAMLGGAMGKLFSFLLPEIAGPAGAYALVGMAAVFAATARAPLTATLLAVEMSDNYFLILPLVVATLIATSFARWLHPESIYTEKLSRRGLRLAQGQDLDILQTIQVQEVMQREPVTVRGEVSLPQLLTMFQQTSCVEFPVLDEYDKLYGIVSLQDLRTVLATADQALLERLRVADIAQRDLLTVYPEDSIGTALQRLAPRGLARLPVVSREDPHRLLGLITRGQMGRAYEIGLAQKQRGQMLDKHVSLRQQQNDNKFFEFQLTSDDQGVGMRVKELQLPKTVNLVSVERGTNVFIPKGDTMLASGDAITFYGKKAAVAQVRLLLTGGRAKSGKRKEVP